MRKILRQIICSIGNFFNRMADQEAKRVIELYGQLFEVKSKEGGEK
jgi:hypothetical protein